jgi:dUTP pyrophosphatase
MIENIKHIKELKRVMDSLKSNNDDFEFNPAEFISKLGIDIDQLEEKFQSEFKKKLEVLYSLDNDNPEPEYHYDTDSGFDLRSSTTLTLEPGDRALIPTGLRIDIPSRYEIQVRPKSGLTLKKGLTVLNTPGTVDQGYTGEIKVIVINLGKETQTISVGDKIAQAVLSPVIQGGEIQLKRISKIVDKDRNSNGFGSTGN